MTVCLDNRRGIFHFSTLGGEALKAFMTTVNVKPQTLSHALGQLETVI